MVVTEAAGALRFTCRQLKAETAAYVGTYRHLEWHTMLSFVKIVSKIGEAKAREIVSIYLPRLEEFIPLMFDDLPKNKVATPAHFPSLECIESSEGKGAVGVTARSKKRFGGQSGRRAAGRTSVSFGSECSSCSSS